MQTIYIEVNKKNLLFYLGDKNSSYETLNDTTTIDFEKVAFTLSYINKNKRLLLYFLKMICLKHNINEIDIFNQEISETIVGLAKDVIEIERITFSFNNILDYKVSNMLLNIPHLSYINCFNMPEIFLMQFPKNRVETRNETIYYSNFMLTNNIKTLSRLYSASEMIIDLKTMNNEMDDIKSFFSRNKKVSNIVIHNYNRKEFFLLLEFLKEINYHEIVFKIIEKSDITQEILNDIELFKTLKKKYNAVIKIEYSSEYCKANRKKENYYNITKYALGCLVVGAFSTIVYNIFDNHNTNDSMRANIGMINEVISSTEEENTDLEYFGEDKKMSNSSYVSPYYIKYSNMYDKLLEINPDTVGWIKVNNTRINYPIVQTTNNTYYLNHAFDKSKMKYGWIFVDYRNNLSKLNKNTIIYGHNIYAEGLMFGTLEKVLNSSWNEVEDNLYISLDIKGTPYKWKIFSAYTIEETTDYLDIGFNKTEDYVNFINKIKERSIKDFKTDVSEGSKILTLSTCYKNSKNRLVVHAVFVE